MIKASLFSLLFLTSMVLYCQITWEDYPGNPVLEVGPDSFHIHPAAVIKSGETYHHWMWGGRTDGENEENSIFHMVSNDGFSFDPSYDYPVLKTGEEGTWDEYAVLDPSVLFVDSLYHMWYEGISKDGDRSIGHAISTDGIHWQKDTLHNPLQDLTYDTLDYSDIGEPCVVYDGKEYHMWYTYDGIGHATSSDGIHWKVDSRNPVLYGVAEFGRLGSMGISNPTVVFDGSTFHMWYLAVSHCWFAICYNTSVDGSIWASDTVHNQVFQGGDWMYHEPHNPVVIYDKDESCYKMWYQPPGGDMVAYATSEVPARTEKKPSPPEQVYIYPNPVENSLQIVSDSRPIISVEIHTLNGQLISTLLTEGSTLQLDFSSFQKGVYFITIRSKDFVTTRKIIKL